MMAKGGKWIQSAIKRPGAFTKKANAAGMGVQEFANKVTSNSEAYPTRTVRQANLAKTLKNIRKGEDGMEVEDGTPINLGKNPRDVQWETAPQKMPMKPSATKKAMSIEDEMDEVNIEAIDPDLKLAKKDLQDLERQAERENVRRYQKMLNDKFGAGLTVDGAWGPQTQKAYEKFILSKPKTVAKATEPNPMTKNPERDLPNFERMSPVEIKVKRKPEPPRILPKAPIPQIQPKLSDYLPNKPAINNRSYSDNTRVVNPVRPVTMAPTKTNVSTPKYTNPNQTFLNQAPNGYRSFEYMQMMERLKKKK